MDYIEMYRDINEENVEEYLGRISDLFVQAFYTDHDIEDAWIVLNMAYKITELRPSGGAFLRFVPIACEIARNMEINGYADEQYQCKKYPNLSISSALNLYDVTEDLCSKLEMILEKSDPADKSGPVGQTFEKTVETFLPMALEGRIRIYFNEHNYSEAAKLVVSAVQRNTPYADFYRCLVVYNQSKGTKISLVDVIRQIKHLDLTKADILTQNFFALKIFSAEMALSGIGDDNSLRERYEFLIFAKDNLTKVSNYWKEKIEERLKHYKTGLLGTIEYCE